MIIVGMTGSVTVFVRIRKRERGKRDTSRLIDEWVYFIGNGRLDLLTSIIQNI